MSDKPVVFGYVVRQLDYADIAGPRWLDRSGWWTTVPTCAHIFSLEAAEPVAKDRGGSVYPLVLGAKP